MYTGQLVVAEYRKINFLIEQPKSQHYLELFDGKPLYCNLSIVHSSPISFRNLAIFASSSAAAAFPLANTRFRCESAVLAFFFGGPDDPDGPDGPSFRLLVELEMSSRRVSSLNCSCMDVWIPHANFVRGTPRSVAEVGAVMEEASWPPFQS